MTDAPRPARPQGPGPAAAPPEEATAPWPPAAPRAAAAGFAPRGGALPPGARVGQVAIRRLIGLGGFGVTYEGENALGVRVAVKEFRPATLLREDGGGDGAAEARKFRDWALRRFEASTRALFELSHPAIVKVFDYVRAEDANGEPTGFMVMEFVDGRPLSAEIEARGGRLPAAELLPLLQPVLDALAYLHGLGRAHRDVAPDNIMVRPDGRAVLIDFGEMKAIEAEAGLAARAQAAGRGRDRAGGLDEMPPLGPRAAAALAQTTRAVAKPFYSPPEQRSVGAAVSPAGDVYALAAVIHRAIAGAPPLDADDRIRALTLDGADPYEPLAVRAPDAPAGLARAVDAALSLRVADRPADMTAFAARLRAEDGSPAASPREPHAGALAADRAGEAAPNDAPRSAEAPVAGGPAPAAEAGGPPPLPAAALGGVTRPGRPARRGARTDDVAERPPGREAEATPGGENRGAPAPRRRAGARVAAAAALLALAGGAAAWVAASRRADAPLAGGAGTPPPAAVTARAPDAPAPRAASPAATPAPTNPASTSPAPAPARTAPAAPPAASAAHAPAPRATAETPGAEARAPETRAPETRSFETRPSEPRAADVQATNPAAPPAPTVRPLVPPPAPEPRRQVAAPTTAAPAPAPPAAPLSAPEPAGRPEAEGPAGADVSAVAPPPAAPPSSALPPPLALPGAALGGQEAAGAGGTAREAAGALAGAPGGGSLPGERPTAPTGGSAAIVPPAPDLRRPVPPAALPDPRDGEDAAPAPAPPFPAPRPPPLPAPVEIASAPTVAAIEPRPGPDPLACRREVAAASGAVRFAPGRAELDAASRATLAALARAAAQCGGDRVEVVTSAAADEAETLRDAERLARARAGAVLVGLAAAGLSEARLVARAAPVGGDPAAPDEERRVRFRVVP